MNFKICTLGCKVNTYESNVMRDKLLNAGYKEALGDIADIYIINTCTVTDTSAHKSLKMVRQCIRKNELAIIIVCGCMPQVEPQKAHIEGVSIILGNKYNLNVKNVELIKTKDNGKPYIVLVRCIKNSKLGIKVNSEKNIGNLKTYQNMFKEEL